MTKVSVFVYGSLEEKNQEKALLEGYEKFYIDDMIYPLIQKKEGSTVQGRIRRDVSTNELKRMDVYEGIHNGKSGFHYKREQVIVRTKKGKEEAFVYCAKGKFEKKEMFSLQKEITKLKKINDKIDTKLYNARELLGDIYKLNKYLRVKLEQIQSVEKELGRKTKKGEWNE